MKMKSCCICGEMPTIEKISNTWWNADHEICDGEPGVSICGCPSADSAIVKWNKWQKKIERREVAIIRVDMIAFGVQPSASIPLQMSLFAEVSPATIGGR